MKYAETSTSNRVALENTQKDKMRYSAFHFLGNAIKH